MSENNPRTYGPQENDRMSKECESTDARSSLAAPTGSAASTDEMTLRELLWLNHGHMGIYGDDGEMQCGQCGLDYKRDSVADIKAAFERMGLENIKRLHTIGSPPTCEWICYGFKKSDTQRCGAPAMWRGPSVRSEGWLLCDAHKTALIKSYNQRTQIEETPKWVKVENDDSTTRNR